MKKIILLCLATIFAIPVLVAAIYVNWRLYYLGGWELVLQEVFMFMIHGVVLSFFVVFSGFAHPLFIHYFGCIKSRFLRLDKKIDYSLVGLVGPILFFATLPGSIAAGGEVSSSVTIIVLFLLAYIPYKLCNLVDNYLSCTGNRARLHVLSLSVISLLAIFVFLNLKSKLILTEGKTVGDYKNASMAARLRFLSTLCKNGACVSYTNWSCGFTNGDQGQIQDCFEVRVKSASPDTELKVVRNRCGFDLMTFAEYSRSTREKCEKEGGKWGIPAPLLEGEAY